MRESQLLSCVRISMFAARVFPGTLRKTLLSASLCLKAHAKGLICIFRIERNVSGISYITA